MDYLYGKLNKEVEKSIYHGVNTETAEITIDNANMTISVDVKGGHCCNITEPKLPPYPKKDGKYVLVVEKGVAKWVLLE